MEVKIREMSLNELLDELNNFFNEDKENNYFSKPTCTDDKECVYEHVDKERGNVKVSGDTSTTIKHLREVIKLKDKEIKKLQEEKIDVEKDGRIENGNYDRILGDKVMADGYKIVNDIKVWVEFVRKCGRLESPAFKTMLDMLNKTVSCIQVNKTIDVNH